MKKYLKAVVSGLCAAALALGCVGCGSSAQNAKPAQVTNITVWTYYNGDQLESFTDLVDEFNETVGAEKGIVVSTESQGSVNDLEQSVMDAAEGKVGASELPPPCAALFFDNLEHMLLSCLMNKHRIAKGKEPVFFTHGLLIGRQNVLPPCQRRHQHDERGFR